MKKQIAIDWQKCAEALNLKLNLIGARLKELNHDAISGDIVYITAQLVEEFNLDTDQMFIRPDVAELQKKLDSVESMLVSLRYASLSRRDGLLSDALSLLGKISFDLSLLASFTLEAK